MFKVSGEVMNIRLLEIEEPKFPYRFRQSKDAYEAVKDYGRADREVFLVLLLNSRNQMIACEPLSAGTVDTAAVHPREVLRAAIIHNASSVILAHNHPSGDVTPSKADLDITAQVILVCSAAGIRVLDHIIVGRGTFLSMADKEELSTLQQKATALLNTLEMKP